MGTTNKKAVILLLTEIITETFEFVSSSINYSNYYTNIAFPKEYDSYEIVKPMQKLVIK